MLVTTKMVFDLHRVLAEMHQRAAQTKQQYGR
jgi:hypothetical protein